MKKYKATASGSRYSISHIKRKEYCTAYLYLLPALLGLTFITVLPLIGVFFFSLLNWSGLKAPEFIGLKNYIKLFTTDLFFGKSVIVTIYYAVCAVFGSMVYSFFIALMLNRKIPARGFWRSIYYIPYIIPQIATCILWAWMYDANFGLLNYLLNSIGLPKSMWLYSPRTSVPSMALMSIWCCGNLIVIFLAGLQNVPSVYSEAAEIDGANSFQRFWHITIPMMTPIIFYNLLMSLITNMQIFVPSFALTNGGPSDSTLFMAFYMYREGFIRNNMGYASAISFIFFVIIAIFTAILFRSSTRWLFYEGDK